MKLFVRILIFTYVSWVTVGLVILVWREMQP